MPANPASALGEAAGKLFESAVFGVLERVVGEYGHTVQPQRLVNEMVLFQEPSINAAIARLLQLMPDDVDVASLTQNRGSARDS